MTEDHIAQHTLEVPGARLYYETKGSGPLLLLIPGANGENTIYKPVRQYLSDRFTVVTYDRRGFSKSTLNGAQDYERRLETDADDARRLIAHLTDQPATIFGSSSGAIVALEVLIKYPAAVLTVIAHEPPLINLLPDAVKWRGIIMDVYDTYQKSGMKVAFQKFASEVSAGDDTKVMEQATDPNRGEYTLKNTTYWFEHEICQYSLAKLDIDALSVHANRLILAGGLETRGHFPYFPNAVLAKMLKKEILDLPGGHVGYFLQPVEFARLLLDGLKQRGSKL